MKITDIKVKAVEVPLVHPFRISLGVINSAISCVVKIETDEGIIGYGEGAPGVLITGENRQGTIAAIENHLAPALIGCDPTDLEKVYWIMNRAVAAHAPCGKTAIDIACHDILGKKAGLPVYKLLGGENNMIETDITVGIDVPEIMAEKAATHVKAGFNVIKTKVGTSMAEDIARVKAIRAAVGDDVKIRVDANQAWTAKEAVNTIERLNEFGLELCEQPVRADDIDGLAYVTAHTSVPIMSDESCFNSHDALRLVSSHAVDIVNIKLMKCGGIREAQKINAICEAGHISVMLGCMAEETNIGVTAAASLGAACHNITRADLDASFSLTSLPFKGGFEVRNTRELVLSEKPGFGFEGFANGEF